MDCRYEAVRCKAASPVVIDDLLEGMNEWRNIQDIVRVTFKAFHDVLKAQGDAIRGLERAAEGKEDRREVAAALAARGDAAELSARLHDVEAQLERKADAKDLSKRALKRDVDALIGTSIGDVMAAVRERPAAAAADAEALAARTADKVAALRGDLSRLGRGLDAVRDDVRRCATHAEVAEALQSKAERRDVDAGLALKADGDAVAAELAGKAGRRFVEDMEADLKAAVKEQALRLAHTVDAAALDSLRDGAHDDLHALQSQLSALSATVSRLDARIADEEVARREAVARKADVAAMQGALERKADHATVARCLDEKADAAVLERLQDSAAAADEAASEARVLRAEMGSLASSKDVCSMLDTKANTEDVNKVLADVCRELEAKAGAEELQAALREQAVVNAGLCADMSLGRWIWKSGKTKSGKGVPWNVQTINSDPDNFVWEKDRAAICTIAPGLYEITFGIFAKRKPTVQVLVNGEPVLSAINSSSYVTHHSSGRLAAVGGHPAGNVTGLTCLDFLALPAKARVAITYAGDERGEGFLSLKRL